MARAQLGKLAPVGTILALGQGDKTQQRIRHALAGGQDDGQARRRRGFKDGGNLTEAVGVSNARPPEFVHDPRFGLAHRSGFFKGLGLKAVRLY